MNLMRIFIIIFIFINFADTVFAQKYIELNHAAELKQNGRYLEALEALSIIKNDNQNALFFTARLYYLSGQPQKALKVLADFKKPSWQSLVYQGLAWEMLSNTAAADSSYRESVNLQPNAIALYRLGKIAYNQKDFSKAGNYFKQVITIDSSIRLAYFYLADSLNRQKDYSSAYKYLAKTVNFYPANLQITAELNQVKRILGKSFFDRQKIQIEQKRKKIILPPYKKISSALPVRVGISKNLSTITFSCGADFIITGTEKKINGQANTFYTLISRGNQIRLYDYSSRTLLARFNGSIDIKAVNDYPFYVLSIVYGNKDFWQKEMDRIFRGNFEVISCSKGMTLINILSVEDYLCGVLSAEIPADSPMEALKAQAVAARTIAITKKNRHKKDGFDFCADVHCQSYQGLSAETPRTIQAVQDTAGEILEYDEKPVETFYHANCGGCLRDDPFGEPVEYLETQFDDFRSYKPFSPWSIEEWFLNKIDSFCSLDEGNKYRWQRIYDSQDFKIIFGFELKDLISMRVQERGNCAHVNTMQIDIAGIDTTINNDLKIRNYFDKLRSSAFLHEIAYKNNYPAMLIFWGAGFGHGAGLCQDGSINMARQGFTYKDILKHYYPKTQIEKY